MGIPVMISEIWYESARAAHASISAATAKKIRVPRVMME